MLAGYKTFHRRPIIHNFLTGRVSRYQENAVGHLAVLRVASVARRFCVGKGGASARGGTDRIDHRAFIAATDAPGYAPRRRIEVRRSSGAFATIEQISQRANDLSVNLFARRATVFVSAK